MCGMCGEEKGFGLCALVQRGMCPGQALSDGRNGMSNQPVEAMCKCNNMKSACKGNG